jgi:hypothetical protein
MPPSRPVAQKSHASAHPTCELTHSVYFAAGSASSAAAPPLRRRSFSARAWSGSGSGMRTASISRPSGNLNKYFKKPSLERRRSRISRSGHTAASASAIADALDNPRTVRSEITGGAAAGSRCTAAGPRCTAEKTRAARSRPMPIGCSAAAISARSRLRRLIIAGFAPVLF